MPRKSSENKTETSAKKPVEGQKDQRISVPYSLWQTDVAQAYQAVEFRMDTLLSLRHAVGILYSGGLDSVALALLLPKAQLHMMGKRSLDHDCPELRKRVKVFETSFFTTDNPNTTISWGRNTIYATLSAALADVVVVGGTASDSGSDKDEAWARHMTELFRHVCQYPNMADARRTCGARAPQVAVPFSAITKSQIVQLVENYCGPGAVWDILFKRSTSCEREGEVTPSTLGKKVLHQCGQCPGCFWKACVFKAHNNTAYNANKSAAFGGLDPVRNPKAFAWVEQITRYRWSPAIEEITRFL